ncbi:methyltransferase [Brevundimonas sp.]|uniref:class I SAM-dependent methyltransferase n=1 Tax=Brevundimonas sp. TaxID=1871086 RepID=UPI002E0F7475|nr:methyltransferase [Brevundimonas sp.]
MSAAVGGIHAQEVARPAADLARDDVRKPYAVMEFAGIEPDMTVAEYMPGGGYFTRILSIAVGSGGRIWAYQPDEIVRLRPEFLTGIRAVAAEPGLENVTVLTGATSAFAPPGPVDVVFTAQNYHDLYGPFAAPGTGEAFDRAVFAALRPGGIYLIIDHHAAEGVGLSGGGALHRIERDAVIAAVTEAGFELEAQSELLANPDDPLTASVFDPSIQGKTSQFMLLFRKPG